MDKEKDTEYEKYLRRYIADKETEVNKELNKLKKSLNHITPENIIKKLKALDDIKVSLKVLIMDSQALSNALITLKEQRKVK
jgi:hypothetical protein